MHTTFQKLCIRSEPGFAYDKSNMVQLTDGGSFSEMLVKITSKCDTSLMLLSSHKGPIKQFAIKVIGLKSPKPASSVTSAVLSGLKKGLSFINGSADMPNVSDEDQVAEAWQGIESQGYHGMQVLTLIDSQVLPDNECRELYNLWQFVTITLQSINAYYMFQKPAKAFQYDSDYSFSQLMQAYPSADTFALAVLWKFENERPTGPIRATPIIRSSVFSPQPRLPRTNITTTSTTTTITKRKIPDSQDCSSLRSEKFLAVQRGRRGGNSGVAVAEPPQQVVEMEVEVEEEEEEFESFSSRESSPVVQGITKLKVASPIVVTAAAKSEAANKNVSEPSVSQPEIPVPSKRTSRKKMIVSEAEIEQPPPIPVVEVRQSEVSGASMRTFRKKGNALEAEIEQPPPIPVAEVHQPEVSNASMRTYRKKANALEAEIEQPPLIPVVEVRQPEVSGAGKRTTRKKAIAPEAEIEQPTPIPVAEVRQPEVPVAGKRTYRKKIIAPEAGMEQPPPNPVVEVQQQEVPDVPLQPKTRRAPAKRAVAASQPSSRRSKKAPESSADDSLETEVSIRPSVAAPPPLQEEAMETDEGQDQTIMDPTNMTLAFDDAPDAAKKPRGRKSMVASARKSLANEWPQADQDHMLHFFDNLNPQHSETSRVALSCKYALLQYDRDLSSKLLYQWIERKGRTIQREVTDFNLPETEQKSTVLKLFSSLSEVQNEATRVSFVLKFIQTQYGVTITSKQLYTWLKEKPKKGKK
ncbi:mediator of DNA damage checkpoint protein 1 [Hyalella azteca]|uniref:Mediator of DNA damage checkpoint protein 1 n=1 Tax=Hyalella azteca TaxID=294128 RepID=A0A8B7NEV2_HYAAZ|nr:mediator of DNA damage checkpoint protein 1 [Hyalella azteca]